MKIVMPVVLAHKGINLWDENIRKLSDIIFHPPTPFIFNIGHIEFGLFKYVHSLEWASM